VKTQVSKWGNSFAVRIPKPVADAADLRMGDTLHVDVAGLGAVLLRKPQHEPTLAEFVREMILENRYAETDWGKPVGCELW
jgi:antitoxin MazE